MAPQKASANSLDKPPKDVWIILLCGLPGSGKSTIRERLVQSRWAYVSQDEMLTAEACEKALLKALKNGQSCIVDRCNVTPSDRRLWLQHARKAVEKGTIKGVTLHFEAVWMATPPEVCKKRARSRENHDTLSPDQADRVIDDFCRGLRPPERSGQEPYDAVHFIAEDEHANLLFKRYANPSCVDVQVRLPTLSEVMAASQVAGEALPDEEEHQEKGAIKVNTLPADLFIIRHGERADRAKYRDDGWADDPPLTKEGRATAKRAGIALRSMTTSPWAAVYSSPFYRCMQTANEIAAELQLPVKLEPGLSELCIERVFAEAPKLREPEEAMQGALTRAEADLSVPPIMSALPQWPEQARDANSRVLKTAQALAARHPGQAICLVCHSHSVVELTRHLPTSRSGGAAASHADYCALSQISFGKLHRCLDLTYLGLASSSSSSAVVSTSASEVSEPVGRWKAGWSWSNSIEEVDPVSALLQLGLDEVLKEYKAFRNLFEQGSSEKQQAWRDAWRIAGNSEVRSKLERAYAAGIFG
eukprot:TRINITY_DN19287_c0_g1_i1.p1 TRINITY_DN19287_c0_g1~~TRINITY_DN19287_c0_g1_i1.p1  ORF type:complete len:532 (-),score=102.18 TRINITY_DN19287_c0_g1_i1:222-1817(-)